MGLLNFGRLKRSIGFLVQFIIKDIFRVFCVFKNILFSTLFSTLYDLMFFA
jgi:hypothetical protein